MTEIPGEVYVIGLLRPLGEVSPIRDEDTGAGISPLSVLDADGERALPAFTTQAKAAWGMNTFMSEEQQEQSASCVARVELGGLLKTLGASPDGVPKVNYVGIDMGEGEDYPLIRL